VIKQLHNKVEKAHVHTYKGISPLLHSSSRLAIGLVSFEVTWCNRWLGTLSKRSCSQLLGNSVDVTREFSNATLSGRVLVQLLHFLNLTVYTCLLAKLHFKSDKKNYQNIYCTSRSH